MKMTEQDTHSVQVEIGYTVEISGRTESEARKRAGEDAFNMVEEEELGRIGGIRVGTGSGEEP